MIAKSNGFVWNARSFCVQNLSRPANGIMPKATLVSIAMASAGSVRSEASRRSNVLLATFHKNDKHIHQTKLGILVRPIAYAGGVRPETLRQRNVLLATYQRHEKNIHHRKLGCLAHPIASASSVRSEAPGRRNVMLATNQKTKRMFIKQSLDAWPVRSRLQRVCAQKR